MQPSLYHRLVCLFAAACFTIHFFAIASADTHDDWQKMRQIKPLSYVATYATTPIKIDGALDDEAWRSAPWSEKHSDIEGDAKPKPRFETKFKLLWDEQRLYFGCRLEEPHVWGKLTKHDSVIFHDNDIEIFIDPDGDNHKYFEFEMNALNTGWDLFLPKPYKDGGSADNGWEIPGLATAVHIQGTLNNSADDDSYWSVEVAIPWSAFQSRDPKVTCPEEGDHWRMNFSRVQWEHEIVDGNYQKVKGKREANWVWSPQGIIDMHRPERWGYVWFTKKPVSKFALAGDPTLPIRDALMTVYHAQKALQKSEKRLPAVLSELKIDEATKSYLADQDFTMNVGSDGVWAATLKVDGIKMQVDNESKLILVD